MTAMDLIVAAAILLLVAGTLIVIVRGSFTRGRGATPGALTAFHDFGSADKQRAMEMVIEQKAGKKLEEQESGEGATPRTAPRRSSAQRGRRGARRRGKP